MSNKSAGSKSATKVVEKSESSQPKPHLFLDQLEVDVTGTIVVMIGRGNMIHCTAKLNVAHNFLRLKEGGIYVVKNFVVLPNKDEFRIFKQDMFMLEFDGETTTRKVSADPHGYLRYPFQLMAFDQIEPANNKYLIDNLCGRELKTNNSSIAPTKAVLAVDCSLPKEGTLENLLIWARNRQNNRATFHCKVMVLMYRLEVVVADDTAHTVVVMFNDTTTELVKCSAESLMAADDEGAKADDDSNFPNAIRNLIGTTHILEIKSHTYYEYGTFESFTCWKINSSGPVEDSESSSTPTLTANDAVPSMKRLSRHPTVSELEDSDVDEVCGLADKKKKMMRYIEDDSESA
ncbi:DNA helicase PIF1, ATP-dependent [Tanacetum coccineum]